MEIINIMENIADFICKVCLFIILVGILIAFITGLTEEETSAENIQEQQTQQITVEIPGKEKDELYYAELEYYRIQSEYYQYQLDEYRAYREGMRN